MLYCLELAALQVAVEEGGKGVQQPEDLLLVVEVEVKEGVLMLADVPLGLAQAHEVVVAKVVEAWVLLGCCCCCWTSWEAAVPGQLQHPHHRLWRCLLRSWLPSQITLLVLRDLQERLGQSQRCVLLL